MFLEDTVNYTDPKIKKKKKTAFVFVILLKITETHHLHIC